MVQFLEDNFQELIGLQLRVLVAEDNDNHYLLLNRIMDKFAPRLVRAVNGEEAVRWANKEKFDVVLMDMGMPVMDGVEATREIRKNNQRICIIGSSAEAFEEDRRRALDAGCNGFVSKPIQREDLLGILYELLCTGDKK